MFTFVSIPTLLRTTLLEFTLQIWYYHLHVRLIVYYFQGHLFIHQTLSPYLYAHILIVIPLRLVVFSFMPPKYVGITNLKCVFNRRSLTYQLRSTLMMFLLNGKLKLILIIIVLKSSRNGPNHMIPSMNHHLLNNYYCVYFYNIICFNLLPHYIIILYLLNKL